MSNRRIKVLHVLANSRPDLNGYAIRTHDLLIAQLDTGRIEPIGITSPFYPERETMVEDCQIDNISYLRCPHPLHQESYKKFGAAWLIKKAIVRHKKRQSNEISREKVEQCPPPDKIEEIKAEQIQCSDFLAETLFFKIKFTTLRITRIILKIIRPGFMFTRLVVRRTLRLGIRNSHRLGRILRLLSMWIEERLLMRIMEKSILDAVRDFKIEIIHAHTPYRVGRPALRAAKRLKIPFVYEMRGCWEDTAVANGRWKTTSLAYRRYRLMETRVLNAADQVICISQTLRNEVIARGVSPDKICVVQNAVNPDKFRNKSPNAHFVSLEDQEHLMGTIAKLNINSATCVIGYVGSLRELEGVDDTASAVAQLNNAGHDVRLLVVSGSANQDALRKHCDQLKLGNLAVITGPVSHERVAEYYKLIDVFVVSRPDTRVTRLVTPLKPFEAMVMERAVICSNLPALAEIIDDGKTGRLYPAGDVEKLAETILCLSENQSERQKLGSSGREWVESERTWSAVTKPIPELYTKLIHHSGK